VARLPAMVALRSRRLETLFGASPLDQLRAEHVRALVSSHVREAFDIDFKATTYGHSDRQKRDLAVDVAALANTAGGVIVLGVEEDDQAQASSAPGVDLTDDVTRHIEQVVADLVFPKPDYDILPVPDENALAHGFVVIAVPRSPNTPHAVQVNQQALRYPKRNDTTTRYLYEHEVAAAYRERLAGAARQGERAIEVEREAIRRLETAADPWVIVSLVPDLPGDFTISKDVFQAFRDQVIGSRAAIVGNNHFLRASVGRRRLLADGTRDNSPLTAWVTVELHADGAGVYGLMVPDLYSRDRTMRPDLPQLVFDESLVIAVLSGLLYLARHGRDRTAAGGNAVARAQLLPISGDRPMAVGHMRLGVADSRSPNALEVSPGPAEAVTALDVIAQPGPELFSVAAVLSDEIGQAFGVPEMGQLTHGGELRLPYWSPHTWRNEMVAWAKQHGITCSEAGLG
jgi:Putative DNA-binding domain